MSSEAWTRGPDCQVCQAFLPSGSRHQVSRQYRLRLGLRYPEGVTDRRRAVTQSFLTTLVAVEDKLLSLAIGMDGKRLRLLDARIAGHVRGRHRPHEPTAAAGQIEQQPTDHCHKRRPGKVAVRAGPEWRFCGTRTFDRRHGSRRDREARCSGGVLKSLAEGGGWRSIKRYRAHPLYDTRLEMDTHSPCGATKAPVFVWPSSGGERESRPMTQKARTACYTRNRFVKARPAPDFRYCSKFSARLGSTNSIDTISAQGRCAAVAREPPLLCVASRRGTSAVSPT
jgi:hypothetical protein